MSNNPKQLEMIKSKAVPIRKIGCVAVASAVARGAAIGSNFIVLPIALAYLGTERFGLLVTVTSFVTLFVFMDLGVGNAMMNVIASSDGKTDDPKVVVAVALAYRLALVVCAIGLVIATFIPFWSTTNLAKLLGVNGEQAMKELQPLLGLFIVLLVLGLLTSLVQRIQMGQQKGYWANLWQAVGSLMALIAIIVATRLDAGILSILIAIMGAPVIAQFINSAIFFARERALFISLFTVTAAGGADFLQKSLGFFGLQVIAAVTFHSGPAIISYLNGASQTAEYGVAFRLYSIPVTLTSFITVALWPAYSQAYARGDMAWIRIRFVQALFSSVAVAGAVTVGIYLLRDPIMRFWLNDSSLISDKTHLAFMVQCMVTIFSANISALLNGVGIIRFQLWTSVVMAMSSFAGAIVLTPTMGPAGPVWSTTIGLLICVLLPSSLVIVRMLVPRPLI